MTNPNSASPQPEEINSAPSLWKLKTIQLVSAFWFWYMAVAVSYWLADFLYGVPRLANSNSALYYLLAAIIYMLWSSMYPFKHYMPQWSSLVPVLGLASVLLLKYDSPLFVAATTSIWMFTAAAFARYHVFPWSPYIRLCFVSDRHIYEAAARAETEV